MTTTNDSVMTTLRRTGLPPIKFLGELIGCGSTKTAQNNGRWTEVEIYRTAAGRYLWHVGNLTCWEGEHDYYTAGSCATPAEVIAALMGDEHRLGRASQEACEDAAETDPAFKFEEVID